MEVISLDSDEEIIVLSPLPAKIKPKEVFQLSPLCLPPSTSDFSFLLDMTLKNNYSPVRRQSTDSIEVIDLSNYAEKKNPKDDLSYLLDLTLANNCESSRRSLTPTVNSCKQQSSAQKEILNINKTPTKSDDDLFLEVYEYAPRSNKSPQPLNQTQSLSNLSSPSNSFPENILKSTSQDILDVSGQVSTNLVSDNENEVFLSASPTITSSQFVYNNVVSQSSSTSTFVASQYCISEENHPTSSESIDPSGPKTKRKKRTKDEIEHERLVKEVNKIRREMTAAKNSKCEQYLFCYVNINIVGIDDAIKQELLQRYEERSISEQLVFDNKNEMKIVWKRKRVEAFIEDGKLHTTTNMNAEGVFVIVIDAEALIALVKSKTVNEFLERHFANHKIADPHLTVIVFGKCGLREATLNDVLFDAYERFRVQFRFAKNALEFSFLVAQFHRAIAKSEKKSERESMQLPGIREGPHLVLDWWTRMLEQMHRLSEDQKRALTQHYPNPFVLSKFLNECDSAGDAMFELANIEMSRGKRIGPVIAQKIYRMLTSWDGTEILHSG